jgi:NADH-quinone oxidoreductase subunit J
METWFFFILGGTALFAAINVVAQHRVFYAALSLILCLVALSGLYLLLQAPFIAAVQIIVYAGAIMVLFLFVIMMLDPFSAQMICDKHKYLSYLAVVLGVAVLIFLYRFLQTYDLALAPSNSTPIMGGTGSPGNLGRVLFSEYLLPFEMTSVLILIAIIGAVVLARRRP